MLTLLLNPDLSPVAEDPFLSQFWLKLWVFNMDPKGPSSTFKRSSLKRTTSGSQKVRWSLFGAHSTGDSVHWDGSYFFSRLVLRGKMFHSVLLCLLSLKRSCGIHFKGKCLMLLYKWPTAALHLSFFFDIFFTFLHPETIWLLDEYSVSHGAVAMGISISSQPIASEPLCAA